MNLPDHSALPLLTHVQGTLWIGAMPVGDPDERFQSILCLDGWSNYHPHPHQRMVVVHMLDLEQMPLSAAELHELAGQVNEWCSAGDTLVHCSAGLNRSALVVALALIQRGMAPAAAIGLLRAKRSPDVLSNRTFEQWLLAQRAAQ